MKADDPEELYRCFFFLSAFLFLFCCCCSLRFEAAEDVGERLLEAVRSSSSSELESSCCNKEDAELSMALRNTQLMTSDAFS